MALRGPDDTGTDLDAHVVSDTADWRLSRPPPWPSADDRRHPDRNRGHGLRGETYSDRDIRSELRCLEDEFTTDSDTEVVWRGYLQ